MRGTARPAPNGLTPRLTERALENLAHQIEGYKPLGNQQGLLFEVVAERLEERADLAALVAEQVVKDANIPDLDDILATMVDAPSPGDRRYTTARDQPSAPPVRSSFFDSRPRV